MEVLKRESGGRGGGAEKKQPAGRRREGKQRGRWRCGEETTMTQEMLRGLERKLSEIESLSRRRSCECQGWGGGLWPSHLAGSDQGWAERESRSEW